MDTLIPILAFAATLIAVVSAIPPIVLVFRNPFRPTWLRNAGAYSFAALAITLGFSFATAAEVASLAAAGINVVVAIGLTVALSLALGFLVWRVFRCGERVRRADAGYSPFRPLAAAEKPRSTRAASG